MNGCVTACGLRDRIKAYDFAMHEMKLYLDVNPCDGEAMELLCAYRRKKEELVALYESRFGPYVVVSHDVKGERWCWVDDPWPWDPMWKE